MNEILWLLQDLETESELVFTECHLAFHAAEKIVGNQSAASLPGMGDGGSAGYLYGPGDGTTRVIVRGFFRETLLAMDVAVPPVTP